MKAEYKGKPIHILKSKVITTHLVFVLLTMYTVVIVVRLIMYSNYMYPIIPVRDYNNVMYFIYIYTNIPFILRIFCTENKALQHKNWCLIETYRA